MTAGADGKAEAVGLPATENETGSILVILSSSLMSYAFIWIDIILRVVAIILAPERKLED